MLQPEIPNNIREVIEQSLEQLNKSIDVYFQFVQRGVPVDVIGNEELTNRVFEYANHNISTAFKFAQKFVRVQDTQQLVSLQTEFVQVQLRAIAEQSKGLSETATKALMEGKKSLTEAKGRPEAALV